MSCILHMNSDLSLIAIGFVLWGIVDSRQTKQRQGVNEGQLRFKF